MALTNQMDVEATIKKILLTHAKKNLSEDDIIYLKRIAEDGRKDEIKYRWLKLICPGKIEKYTYIEDPKVSMLAKKIFERTNMMYNLLANSVPEKGLAQNVALLRSMIGHSRGLIEIIEKL